MFKQFRGTYGVWGAALVGALLLAGVFPVRAAGPNVDGAIFTTTGDGTVVNENTRYGGKSEVYLNGGPQNEHANGLPDGYYYFQITDPSGAVLLSTEDITCRVAVVRDGRFAGVPAADDTANGKGDPSCYHSVGQFNPANGTLSVQMCAANGVCPGALPGTPASFYDTPNPGGEYKAWITPVDQLDQSNKGPGSVCRGGRDDSCHGFFDSHSKTDNFKVRHTTTPAADVTVCKFNDFDGNGTRDAGEPLIPHWPITATGVDGGTVDAQTADDGCVTFTYSGFTADHATQTITLAEGTLGPDWTRTAPVDGDDGRFHVSGGVITLDVAADESITAPDFGNTNPFCPSGCDLNKLTVTKTAFPKLTRTFTWGIEKSVDATRIDTAAGANATFNYTVTVTHDAGTDADWAVAGKITVSNPGGVPMTADITDAADNGGACTVSNGDGVVIPAGSHVELDYTCEYGARPSAGTNRATASVADVGDFSGTAAVDFDHAVVAETDEVVDVTDTLYGGSLGTVKASDQSPAVFTYAKSVPAPSGTCVVVDNTATFTAIDTNASNFDTRRVQVCGAADLVASKTAATAFVRTYDWAIRKDVDRTRVEQKGGTATFTYTVAVSAQGSVDSNWSVSGIVSVTNPNDWQSVDVNLADGLAGATCVLDNPVQTAGPGATVLSPYRCSFASAPAVNGANTATVTWDATAAHTAGGSATARAEYAFDTPTEVNKSITVTDTFDGSTTTLGRVTAPASQAFTYSRTVSNAAGGQCAGYNNVAAITETGQSASQSVSVCNTATGGLTMGYWQNKNGQAVIKAANQSALRAYLTQFAPFQDLGTQVIATYVTNVIKSASASGAAMNAMLKGQMLATALNVYTSVRGLGGVRIDLTMVNKPIGSTIYVDASSSFGPASSLTVAQMLTYAASRSNAGGSVWYGQVKNGPNGQELAKDAFDAINNEVAWIQP